MKKAFFLLLLLTCAELAVAQRSMTTKEYAIGNRRRGFIGVTAGASFPAGEFNDKNQGSAGLGLHANLLNFGYVFTQHFGVTAKYFIASNKYDDPANPSSEPWKYSGALAGPLFSYTVARNLELDFHPMGGYAIVTEPRNSGDDKVKSAVGLAANLGSTLQFNFHDRIGIHLGLDYFITFANFKDEKTKFIRKEYRIETLTPSLGVAVRFL